jgi:hypothetical protein
MRNIGDSGDFTSAPCNSSLRLIAEQQLYSLTHIQTSTFQWLGVQHLPQLHTFGDGCDQLHTTDIAPGRPNIDERANRKSAGLATSPLKDADMSVRIESSGLTCLSTSLCNFISSYRHLKTICINTFYHLSFNFTNSKWTQSSAPKRHST